MNIKICSLITFLESQIKIKEINKPNQIENFISKANLTEFMKNLKHISDNFTYLNLEISNNLNNVNPANNLEAFNIIKEIYKDYAFTKNVFQKLEEFLNFFFEHQ